jgi:hypothetical protein
MLSWFPQGCKSQCSHTLKTANIKSCYDPRSRLWYYKAYNRAFLRPYHTQKLLQASIEEGERKLRAYKHADNFES